MQKEESEEVFSLTEKMHLSLHKLGTFFLQYQILIGICVVIFTFALIASYPIFTEIDKFGVITKVDNCEPNIFESKICTLFTPYSDLAIPAEFVAWVYYFTETMVFAMIPPLGTLYFMLFWYLKSGRKTYKELKELRNQFIRQSYLINFETSLPHGETETERFLSIATTVFPEVKEVKKRLEKKGKEIWYREKHEINGIRFDLVVATVAGNLILEFKEHLKFEDVQNFVKRIDKSASKEGGVFRAIIVTKKYDDSFKTDELITKMGSLKRNFPLDLISQEDNGYSLIWID